MAKKSGTGAKKTVGRARKGDIQKEVMRLYYVQKPNGSFAPRYERVEQVAPATAEAPVEE